MTSHNHEGISHHPPLVSLFVFFKILPRLTTKIFWKPFITSPLWGESSSHWWLPLTKDLWWGKCFHVMPSSYSHEISYIFKRGWHVSNLFFFCHYWVHLTMTRPYELQHCGKDSHGTSSSCMVSMSTECGSQWCCHDRFVARWKWASLDFINVMILWNWGYWGNGSEHCWNWNILYCWVLCTAVNNWKSINGLFVS